MNKKLSFVKTKNSVMFIAGIILITGTSMNLFASDKAGIEIVVEGNNKFAFDLYAQLKEADGNLFFSPYSVSTALAMTYAGAKGNTEAQMADVLHFVLTQESLHPVFSTLMQDFKADSEKSGFEFSIANALWSQEGYKFHQAFIDITKSYYEAGFKEVDFVKNTESPRQTINKWVEEKTKDKIKELIKPGILTGDTRLVLTSAIYFKGRWILQFEKKDTMLRQFELMTGEKVEVPMMSQTKKFRYFENEIAQVLEMPYEGNRLSMVIFLPKEKKGIRELEDLFKAKNIKDWLLELRKQEVITSLPRFKMTSEFFLNEALQSLGMTDAFDEKLADFSGMTPDSVGLYISKVIHKAFVDVNEEGTEAAAATAVVKTEKVMPEPKPVFRADYPFIFIIRDMRSGSILFVGRVMDPR